MDDNKNIDKSGLAVKIIAIILVVAAVVGIVVFMVMNKPKVHDDLDLTYAGKYELTSLTGLRDKNGKEIKPSDYEYNYINLGEDGRYEIANKINGKKTTQKGVWYVSEGTVYLESSRVLGFVKTSDKGQITSTTITMHIGASSGTIVMTLTKSK